MKTFATIRSYVALVFGISALVALTACAGSFGTSAKSELPTIDDARSTHPFVTSGYMSIYRFKSSPDGASPFSGLVAISGTLYGTTLNGSRNYCSQNCGGNQCYLGCGTVFSVTPLGVERVVYNFKGNFNAAKDGSWPFTGLTPVNGVLYGTTSSAGAYGGGTVFVLNTSGVERVLHSFAGGADGSGPEAVLTPLNGEFFGTTVFGGGTGCGGYGCGTLYVVTTSGAERVLHAFKGGSDGAKLYSNVIALNGTLYGVTLFGGGTGCGGSGCGTVFEATTDGVERVLYRFKGGTTDGAFPNGLIAVDGTLYGTTEAGGTKNAGIFFSITTSGVEKILHTFQNIPDGNGPGADLIYTNGVFFGTTVGGGSAGLGTVFEATKTGYERALYSFKGGTDGSGPLGPVYDFNSRLFGTTEQGGGTGCGGSGCGTIYSLSL